MPNKSQEERDAAIRFTLVNPNLGDSVIAPDTACLLDRLFQQVRLHTANTPRGGEVSLIFRNRFRFWFRSYPKIGWQYEGTEGGDFSGW